MTEQQIQDRVDDAIREAEEELYYEGKTLTSAQARCIEKAVRRMYEEKTLPIRWHDV